MNSHWNFLQTMLSDYFILSTIFVIICFKTFFVGVVGEFGKYFICSYRNYFCDAFLLRKYFVRLRFLKIIFLFFSVHITGSLLSYYSLRTFYGRFS